jgi:four helix bundle protein
VPYGPSESVAGSRFRDLVAYRLARSLADELRTGALGWETFDRWTIGVQLVRAADSIGVNIAEAYGRYGIADKRRLLHIARGSLFETEHWVSCAAERGLVEPRRFDSRLSELARTLNGLVRRPSGTGYESADC